MQVGGDFLVDERRRIDGCGGEGIGVKGKDDGGD